MHRISRFAGLSGDDSFEALLRYYRKHVIETDFDSISSIMTLTVRAFDATEAHKINEALLDGMRGGTLERIFRKWQVWNSDQPAMYARRPFSLMSLKSLR